MYFFASLLLSCLCISCVRGENPYVFLTWNVSYRDVSPLGVKQQGIVINEQFPGPPIETVTNENIYINVFNNLEEPFLLSWNGLLNRKNPWQDGVYGTTCPIPPGGNYTYVIHAKDQIGSYFYFPSLGLQKAAGGYGSIRIMSRPPVPVPFPPPADDFTILTGDWFNASHTELQAMLDDGKDLPPPDRLLINGQGFNGLTFAVEPGKTYRFRISNVGIATSINVRFQGHPMTLIEVEGSHTQQNTFESLDVHLGQSYSVLITANQPAGDYHFIATTVYSDKALNRTAFIHYKTYAGSTTVHIADEPVKDYDWSLNQAKSIRWNLTASGPRPNPQGSYNYGVSNVTRTIRLANSRATIDGKTRYAVNGISFIQADTPLKLADYYNISGVFELGSIPDAPVTGDAKTATSVMAANFRDFVEIIFENDEDSLQLWHINGYHFFVVGMEKGQWTNDSRQHYNLKDTVARCTVQVYPKAWTAVYMALDNVGMWNIRSENWARQYLGQQFYLRVYSPALSWRDEHPIPRNAILCGKAVGRSTRRPGDKIRPPRSLGRPTLNKNEL